MVKLRTGPGTCHIKSSRGPDANILHFYSTRYSSEYGLDPNEFKPRAGHHVGTGYSSNFRPQLYYSRSQDNLDNPVMGFLLSDNYETVTKQHYRKSRNGFAGLPGTLTGVSESGFVRERPLTVPVSLQASSVFYDTKRHGGKSFPGIPPRPTPILHTLKQHDPTEGENFRRGPKYMSTEMKTRFKGDPTAPLNIHLKDVGNLEESGFTDNKQIEPVTFTDDKCYGLDGQVAMPPPVGSITNTSYMRWRDSNGRDCLPEIRSRTSKDTGFIREQPRRLYTHRRTADAYLSVKDAPKLVHDRLKKNDPSEFLNMKHPNNRTSITADIFEGKQGREVSQEMLLRREARGNQELSGDSWNNYRYEETKNFDTTRYLTDYNMRFYDKSLQGVDREGWVMGGLQGPREDGYRRDFKVHTFGKSLDAERRIKRLDPYVARSVRCKDKFFVDYVHENKIHEDSEVYKQALSTGTLKVA